MERRNIITTNLKFAQHSKSGQVVGFISKVGKNWRGVNENSECKKIIVLLDHELAKKVKTHTVYQCRLIPMTGKFGYVAVSASPMTFNAEVETVMLPRTFKINIHFGNQTIVYDPNSKDKRYNSFDSIVQYLISTNQIRNIGEVIDELRKSINITAAQYVS